MTEPVESRVVLPPGKPVGQPLLRHHFLFPSLLVLATTTPGAVGSRPPRWLLTGVGHRDWYLLGRHEHISGDSWIGDWERGHASQKALA